jgi:hypothetical protein
MKLLLDTHTFIWFVTDHPRLSVTAKALIESGNNEILVSIVSLWEIALKMSLGKLNMGATFDQLIRNDLDCLFTDLSTDPEGPIAAWSWTFGDGATASAQNPSHSYAGGGSYTVGLTVTDGLPQSLHGFRLMRGKLKHHLRRLRLHH